MFVLAFSRNAFLLLKNVHRRRQGRPRIDFGILKWSSDRPWKPQGAKREAPSPPQKIAPRGHWGPRGGRRALRERPWGPKCHFGGMRSYLGKTYIGPPSPPKVAHFFFSNAILGGPKTAKGRFRGGRGAPMHRLWGPLGAPGATLVAKWGGMPASLGAWRATFE